MGCELGPRNDISRHAHQERERGSGSAGRQVEAGGAFPRWQIICKHAMAAS